MANIQTILIRDDKPGIMLRISLDRDGSYHVYRRGDVAGCDIKFILDNKDEHIDEGWEK